MKRARSPQDTNATPTISQNVSASEPPISEGTRSEIPPSLSSSASERRDRSALTPKELCDAASQIGDIPFFSPLPENASDVAEGFCNLITHDSLTVRALAVNTALTLVMDQTRFVPVLEKSHLTEQLIDALLMKFTMDMLGEIFHSLVRLVKDSPHAVEVITSLQDQAASCVGEALSQAIGGGEIGYESVGKSEVEDPVFQGLDLLIELFRRLRTEDDSLQHMWISKTQPALLLCLHHPKHWSFAISVLLKGLTLAHEEHCDGPLHRQAVPPLARAVCTGLVKSSPDELIGSTIHVEAAHALMKLDCPSIHHELAAAKVATALLPYLSSGRPETCRTAAQALGTLLGRIDLLCALQLLQSEQKVALEVAQILHPVPSKAKNGLQIMRESTLRDAQEFMAIGLSGLSVKAREAIASRNETLEATARAVLGLLVRAGMEEALLALLQGLEELHGLGELERSLPQLAKHVLDMLVTLWEFGIEDSIDRARSSSATEILLRVSHQMIGRPTNSDRTGAKVPRWAGPGHEGDAVAEFAAQIRATYFPSL